MHGKILIDSGPLIALFDVDDKFHKEVQDFFSKHDFGFISTLAVFTEVSHMLDFSVNAQQDFYQWAMHHGVIISDINQNDMLRLVELTKKYEDLPMDFADATLVITAEKTGIWEIISLDKHFDIYRLSADKSLSEKKTGREKLHNVLNH